MLGKAIVPVQIEEFDRSAVAADLQHVKLYQDFTAGMERIIEQLRRVALGARGGFDLPPHRPPYPGLMPFEQQDAAVYFGRQPEIAALWEALRSVATRIGLRTIVVSGSSGAGKSSLLRAGLLPRLDFEPDRWRVLSVVRPGGDPLGRLAGALVNSIGGNAADVGKQLRAAPAAACNWLLSEVRNAHGSQDVVPIICFDQFEEIFTETGNVERMHFIDLVRALGTVPYGPVFIITIRSEYLLHLQEASGFGSLPAVWVPDLTKDRIPEMIRGPARVAGIAIDDALVTRATEDASHPGSLPLLAFALRELYDLYGADRALTLEEYLSLAGGSNETPIAAALKQVADRVVDVRALSDADRAILRSLFVPALVRVDEAGNFVRRVAAISEIPVEAQAFLKQLSAARLIRTFRDGGRECVEVAHDALFRNWDVLAKWLADDREYLVIKAQVERDATTLSEPDLTREEDAYLTGFRLARAEELVAHRPDMLSDTNREFVAKSVAARNRRERARRRMWQYALTLSVVAGVGFAALSWVLNIQLETNERQSRLVEAQLFALHAERASEADIYEALSLSLRAVSSAENSESVAVLIQSLLNIPLEVVTRRHLHRDAPPSAIFTRIAGGSFYYATVGGAIVRIATAGYQDDTGNQISVLHPGGGEILALDQSTEGAVGWVSISGEVGIEGIGRATLGKYVDAADIDVARGVIALAIEGAGELGIWRCGTGETEAGLQRCLSDEPEIRIDLEAIDGPARQVALAETGLSVAVSSGSKVLVRGGDGATSRNEIRSSLNGALAWSPTGRRLAVAGDSGLLVMDERGNDETLAVLSNDSLDVSVPVWSPNAEMLAAACGQGGLGLCVWSKDASSLTLLREAYGHSERIRSIFWRGNELLTLDQSGNLVVWDFGRKSAQFVASYEQAVGGQSFGLSVDPVSRDLTVAGGSTVVWVNEGGSTRSFRSRDEGAVDFRTASWGGEGAWLAGATADGQLIVWRPESGVPVRARSLSSKQIERLAWDAETHAFLLGEAAGRLTAFSPETNVVRRSEPLRGEILGVGASPKGGTVIASTDRGEIAQFSASRLDVPEQTYFGSGPDAPAADGISRDAIAFHPSGNYFAVAGNSGRMPVFVIGRADPVAALETGALQVQDVAFSWEGEFFAALDSTRKLHVWRVHEVSGQHPTFSVLFSVDLGLVRRQVPGFLATSILAGVSGGHPERIAWRANEILVSTTNGRLITVLVEPRNAMRRAAEIIPAEPSDW